jgi:hypothetical protein
MVINYRKFLKLNNIISFIIQFILLISIIQIEFSAFDKIQFERFNIQEHKEFIIKKFLEAKTVMPSFYPTFRHSSRFSQPIKKNTLMLLIKKNCIDYIQSIFFVSFLKSIYCFLCIICKISKSIKKEIPTAIMDAAQALREVKDTSSINFRTVFTFFINIIRDNETFVKKTFFNSIKEFIRDLWIALISILFKISIILHL